MCCASPESGRSRRGCVTPRAGARGTSERSPGRGKDGKGEMETVRPADAGRRPGERGPGEGRRKRGRRKGARRGGSTEGWRRARTPGNGRPAREAAAPGAAPSCPGRARRSALDLLEHLEDGAARALEHALEGLRQAATLDRVAPVAVDFGHQWLRGLNQSPVVYRTRLPESRTVRRALPLHEASRRLFSHHP